MKNNRILVCVVSFIICSLIIFSIVSLSFDYEIIDIQGERYYIKAPKEFKGNAFCTYNEEFLNQQNDDGVIKLIFQKNGYYHVKVGYKSYVFKVDTGLENRLPLENYQNELEDIERENLQLKVVSTIIIMIIVCVIFLMLVTTKKKCYRRTQIIQD